MVKIVSMEKAIVASMLKMVAILEFVAELVSKMDWMAYGKEIVSSY